MVLGLRSRNPNVLTNIESSIMSDGKPVPSVFVPPETRDTKSDTIFGFRASSSNGPAIFFEDPLPVLLRVTFVSDGGQTVSLTRTAPASAHCGSSSSYVGTASETYHVVTSCVVHAAGDYDFQVSFTGGSGIAGVEYEFFYYGVLQPALSGIAAGAVTQRNFVFTVPANSDDLLILGATPVAPAL